MLSSVTRLLALVGNMVALRSVSHVKALVPIRIEGFLDHGGRASLLSIDRGDSERVRKS